MMPKKLNFRFKQTVLQTLRHLPERVLETDQRQVLDLDHLTLLLQLAEEHALEDRTAHGEDHLVAVHRLAIDEEANVAQLRIVELRSSFVQEAVRLRGALSVHFVEI